MIQSKHIRSFPSTTAWEYLSSKQLQVLWRRRKAEAQMVDPWIHLPSRGERHKKRQDSSRILEEPQKNKQKFTRTRKFRRKTMWVLRLIKSGFKVCFGDESWKCLQKQGCTLSLKRRINCFLSSWQNRRNPAILARPTLKTCNFLPVGSLVYRISSTQWLKCDPEGNNTPFSSRDACQTLKHKASFHLKCSKTGGFLGGFHFLAQCCPQNLRQAAHYVTYLLLLLPIIHGARFEGKPTKNMRNKFQGVVKRPIWRQKLLGKKGMEFAVVFIPNYTQIKMRPKKHYHRNLKNDNKIKCVPYMVLASGFSSSTWYGIWAH